MIYDSGQMCEIILRYRKRNNMPVQPVPALGFISPVLSPSVIVYPHSWRRKLEGGSLHCEREKYAHYVTCLPFFSPRRNARGYMFELKTL